MKNLQSLIQSTVAPHFDHSPSQSISVLGITADSREVRAGFIFVAISGGTQDGHDHIFGAVQSGAVAIVGEKNITFENNVPVSYVQVSDSRAALAQLASAFYDYPSEKMCVLGVTGTSGKTTTTYLIESILKAAGHTVGVIGTINFRYADRIIPSTHTTPGAVELQKLFSTMAKEGCTAVVMEVSSHALKQYRAHGVAFDAMVFLNLSPEHLDFHPDMEDYFKSKAILFTELADFSLQKGKSPQAVINEADSYGVRLIQEVSQRALAGIQIQRFGKDSTLEVSLSGIRGTVGGLFIESHLTGGFNCNNIEAAVTAAQSLQVPNSAIQNGIKNQVGVPGRLERVESSSGIHIWVDYAHKPDALEKVLKTLGSMKANNRVITVFGCGGDRDKTKRPWMGQIAVQYSDHVIITSDNPRTENPLSIIQEILAGIQGAQNYEVEADRKKAIFRGVQLAKKGDLILIAGKGHEDYQIIGTQKFHFDDREVVREAILGRQA
jgi:UDP-N-acetylmuramoyl-L-alanyl-D-glutamate--2,6-diaminopimelate ligase